MANVPINVAIQEGWANGPWFTQQLRAAIIAAGYNITSPLQADALIAHSTACFDINPKTPIRRYILIDPPYWPGRTLLACVNQKKLTNSLLRGKELGWKHVLIKTAYEIIYIFKKPRYTLLARKNFGKLDFLNDLKGKQIILVRNEQDQFCSSAIELALAGYGQDIYYVQMPGGHDDYIYNPQPYIDLLPKDLV